MLSAPSDRELFLHGVSQEARATRLLQHAAAAIAASIFVAVCAHIAVPLPLSPVPFTLQPFAVLMVGMVLGPTTGFAALALYLLEGALGLPVFTPVGLPGVARLLGPTGGYLFVYPVAAALSGAFARLLPGSLRFASYVVGGFVAMATIYTGGVLWFSYQAYVPFLVAFTGTVLPFVVFDCIKVIAAAAMASNLPSRGVRG